MAQYGGTDVRFSVREFPSVTGSGDPQQRGRWRYSAGSAGGSCPSQRVAKRWSTDTSRLQRGAPACRDHEKRDGSVGPISATTHPPHRPTNSLASHNTPVSRGLSRTASCGNGSRAGPLAELSQVAKSRVGGYGVTEASERLGRSSPAGHGDETGRQFRRVGTGQRCRPSQGRAPACGGGSGGE